MAERNPVAILREMALVKGSTVGDNVKAILMSRLNAEMEAIVGQQTLPGVPSNDPESSKTPPGAKKG